MGKSKKGSVAVLVGTRKGAFILKSDARCKTLALEGPHFPGQHIDHFVYDPRDYTRDEGKQWNLFNNLLPPILSVEAAVI